MNQDNEKALQEVLRQTLQRKNPPPGFVDRVMARLPEVQSSGGNGAPYAIDTATGKRAAPAAGPANGNVRTMPAARPVRRQTWLAIGLAASLAVGSFAGLRYQQYRQGQEASRQLMLALHIAGEKLTLAQHKVVGDSERRIDQ